MRVNQVMNIASYHIEISYTRVATREYVKHGDSEYTRNIKQKGPTHFSVTPTTQLRNSLQTCLMI